MFLSLKVYSQFAYHLKRLVIIKCYCYNNHSNDKQAHMLHDTVLETRLLMRTLIRNVSTCFSETLRDTQELLSMQVKLARRFSDCNLVGRMGRVLSPFLGRPPGKEPPVRKI